MAKKVIIFGGTGFIGRELINLLLQANFDIHVVTRNPQKAFQLFGNKVNFVKWDSKSHNTFTSLTTGDYTVINLAGENIGARLWTGKQKAKILESRVTVTNFVSEIINRSLVKPEAVIQASAAGFYGSDMDLYFDESSGKGEGFLADVTEQWEKALEIDDTSNTRIIYLRSGLVLGRNEGLVAKLKILFKFYAGGHFGNGKQWMSWIHIQDEARAIKFLLLNKKTRGIYNLSAPDPVRMSDFCKAFGAALSRPSWLHIPSYVLKILPGEMAEEILLSGQKIKPERLLSEGFDFRYVKLEEALNDLLS